MARSKQTFERRERERAKKAKASAKRERRQSGAPVGPDDEDVETTPAGPEVDQGEVIAALGELTAAFDRGDVNFEDFETERARLLAQLTID